MGARRQHALRAEQAGRQAAAELSASACPHLPAPPFMPHSDGMQPIAPFVSDLMWLSDAIMFHPGASTSTEAESCRAGAVPHCCSGKRKS